MTESKNLCKASRFKNKSYTMIRWEKPKNNYFLPQRQEQVSRLWFQQTERKTVVPKM